MTAWGTSAEQALRWATWQRPPGLDGTCGGGMSEGGRPRQTEGALEARISRVDCGTARRHSRGANGWAVRMTEGQRAEGPRPRTGDGGTAWPGSARDTDGQQVDGKFQPVGGLHDGDVVPWGQAEGLACSKHQSVP